MKERPILFSGMMVNAILEGRKTVTRRVIKPQPLHDCTHGDYYKGTQIIGHTFDDGLGPRKCQYGLVNDRLWVRETWQKAHVNCWGGLPKTVDPNDPEYAAYYRSGFDRSEPSGWRPSIFMPRWASRLTLEIISIRVERLQDITPSEVRKEGLPDLDAGAVGAFARMWSEINPKYPWQSNPWLWVIEFKKL